MWLWAALTAFLIVPLVLYIYLYYMKHPNLPPKIRGLPFLGVVPWVRPDRPLAEIFHDLRLKYGGIFTIYLGIRPFVVLADSEVMREALVKNAEVFSGRPNIYVAELNTKGKGIVFHQYGAGWKEIRRFTLIVLRDFGVGRSSLEEKIIEEISALSNEIDVVGSRDTPFAPHKLLQNAVSNIICSITFGTRFDYSNTSFRYILDIMNKLFLSTGSGNPLNMFPFLRHIPYFNKFGKEPIICNQLIKGYIQERIEEHRKTFDKSNIRDFIDLYLKAESEGSLSQFIDEEELFQAISDLFNAGTETTSTTLQWALLYLVHYPDLQEKVYQETENVLGSGMLARMKDKPNLPYTSAFLLEVQRHATIAPNGVVHGVLRDTEFRGYKIPAGTAVLACIWCCHRDEKYFPQPDLFNPDRWLDKNGEIKNNDSFMPFSIGPRFCLGEQLAKMELFLFFTCLVQTFKFRGEGKLPRITESISKLTRMPKQFEISANRRV